MVKVEKFNRYNPICIFYFPRFKNATNEYQDIFLCTFLKDFFPEIYQNFGIENSSINLLLFYNFIGKIHILYMTRNYQCVLSDMDLFLRKHLH